MSSLTRTDLARLRRQLCEARAQDFRVPKRGVFNRRGPALRQVGEEPTGRPARPAGGAANLRADQASVSGARREANNA